MKRGQNKQSQLSDVEAISKRGIMRDTLELLLEAIREGNLESDLYFSAANLAFRLGDLEKAEQLSRSLLTIDSENTRGWSLFGEITDKKLKIVNAGDHELIPVLREFSESDSIKVNRELEYEYRENDMSFDKSRESLDFDTITYADICASQGYYNKALKIYQDHLKKNPDNEELKKKIDSIRKRLGND